MTLARTKPAIYYRVSGIVMKPVRLLCYMIFFKVLWNQTVHNVCIPIILNFASRCLLSMVCPRIGEGGGLGTHGKFDIFSFQMSISPPLGLHFESNSHPWGKVIGTHNSLYCSTERLQREIITWWQNKGIADLLYHSFSGPPPSKMATESNFPPGTLRMSNSLPTCASLGLISVGALAHLSMVCPREQVAGWCWPAFYLSSLYWSRWYGEENLRKICLKSRM